MPQEEITVKQHANRILESYGNGEVITFLEFQVFIQNTPGLFQAFSTAFNEALWNSDLLENTATSISRKSFRNSQNCGDVYIKSGDLLTKKYAILRNELLLFYDEYDSKHPFEVIFLKGCYVDILGDQYIPNKFGIIISHQSACYGDVILWINSRAERDDWIKYLEAASNYRRFKDFYSIGEKIGQGKFSEVYICTEKLTYKKWAVKVVTKSKLTALEHELLQSEISILKIISHPGVIKLKEVFDSKSHILIVTELAEGGELFQRIVKKKVFSEYSASKVINQLLEILSYLHGLGIMHRDIKPENILLSDLSDIPNVKLADFGLSKLAGPTSRQTLSCGTLGYVAPEVLSQGGYNYKIDLWSIGILTYLLLRGRLPFDHSEKQVIIELTLKASLDFEEPYWKTFTPLAIEFLNLMIERDPCKRPNSEEAINHPWIRNADILIPRAIDKKKMEDLYIEKGVSSTNFGKVQYKEIAVVVEDSLGPAYGVHSMPQLFEEPRHDYTAKKSRDGGFLKHKQ